MPLANYNDLAAAIPSWLHRDDLLAADINNFVNLCEANLVRELVKRGVREFEKRATATVAAGANRVGLPTDFLQMRNIQLNSNPVRNLTYKTPEAIDDLGGQGTSYRPTFFTLTDCEIQFDCLSDATYTLEVAYLYRPTLLSTGNLTNLFTTQAMDALLFGSLLEACAFIQVDPETELKWKGRYDIAVKGFVDLSWEGKHSGSSLAVSIL
jgi:hypothetical protein